MKTKQSILMLFIFLFTSSAVFADDLKKKLQQLEEDILELKLKNADQNNAWDLTGEFKTVYHINNQKKKSAKLSNDTFSFFASELKLSVDKTDKEHVKFYSTFGASYFWNNNFQNPTVIQDNGQNVLKGTFLFLEKAYFDYFMKDKEYSLSVGRLPTQYGPPLHYSNNMSRQGTYPAIIYSVPLDGIAVTSNLGKIFNTKKRYIMRAIFSPFYNRNKLDAPDEAGRNNPFNSIDAKEGDAFHVNFETSSETSLGNYNIVVQGFYAAMGRPRSLDNIRGVLQGSLTGTTIDNNVYEIGSDDEKLLSMKAAIAYFEISEFLKSKLDIYGSFKKSWFNKRGNFDAVITEDNMGSALGAVGTRVDIGGFIYNQDASGESYFLGGRYNFTKKFNFGVEYIRQTFGNTPTSIRSLKFVDFYNVIGYGYHTYANWNFAEDLNFGLGLIYTEAESDFVTFSYQSAAIRKSSGYVFVRHTF